jgi:pyruvate dehydrogenase E2 component (dihydrolipoamide acetyltransferase)
MLNSTVVDNTIVQKHYVNMGIAVALSNGLIVPNIKNSHLMSLEMISENIITLANKAREGKLSKEEYSNGTFTITNLGMYDLDEFTAVINPPEAAILAIGKIADTPVCVGKAVEIRPILTLSLTYDHRIIDGAPAAEFLQYIKKLLQNPYLLI